MMEHAGYRGNAQFADFFPEKEGGFYFYDGFFPGANHKVVSPRNAWAVKQGIEDNLSGIGCRRENPEAFK